MHIEQAKRAAISADTLGYTAFMDLLSIRENPIPDSAVVGRLRTSDGVHVRFARWPAPPGYRGTVCLFPGRAEFIEKYFEVVRDLRARGFAVAILDWRGQGLSDRPLTDSRKGHVRSFAEYDHDLEVFMREEVLPDSPPPYFALAHSMGGTILIRAAAQDRRWFARTVLSGPLISLPGRAGSNGAKFTARWLRRIGMGSTYIPGGGATSIFSQPFAGNPLTSDPKRYARTAAMVEAHPALALGSPTVGWLAAAYDQMGAMAVPAYPAKLRHPILFISAGADAIVSNPAIEQFVIRMRTGAHVTIPGARHEMLMEQDQYRSQFWAAFDAFVPGEG